MPSRLPSHIIAAEVADLEKKGPVTTADLFSPEMLSKHAADYMRLARASNDAIRAHDPKRLVVTDGYPAGRYRYTSKLPHLHSHAAYPLSV